MKQEETKFNLSETIKWGKTKPEQMFFTPKTKSLRFAGKPTGRQIIYKEDVDGEKSFIDVVSNHYGLVPNTLINHAIESFDGMPLKLNLEQSGHAKGKTFNLVMILMLTGILVRTKRMVV